MSDLAKEADLAIISILEKTDPQLVSTVRELKAKGVSKKEIMDHLRRLGLNREEHLTLLAIEAVMEQPD